jgi:Mn2+/Fe2+ NRAMP family transporter
LVKIEKNGKPQMLKNTGKFMKLIGPGILVAATGVGAGDLLTAGLAGSAIGTALLWAAVAGALLKAFLNEGISRWQLATGTTILEGWIDKLGKWIQWIFLIYFIGWTFLTGGALVSACGVAGNGLLPVSINATTSKNIWGIFFSVGGFIVIRIGGFRVFERLMMFCISLMFFTVLSTAVLSRPDWDSVARGLILPSISPDGLGWTLGVLGGVGGTVTILSYGYWIREKNREGYVFLKTCRLDLGIAYCLTAIFGISMIIIGSKVHISGGGANAAPLLAEQLNIVLGPLGKLTFLIGFWGAVFSSLLGVWQSAPYLFADFIHLRKRDLKEKNLDFKNTNAYRFYQVAITLGSLPFLVLSVKQAQLAYAIFGAFFMPLLALTLLIMNNRIEWVGLKFKNGILANFVLVITLLFFLYVAVRETLDKIKPLF